jgi:ATP-dependent Clp protease ATP-binding subunit ClpC
MYERFTDRARKVMQLANQEAARFNQQCIGTEHILLGLAKEGAGVAANVLKNLGIDFYKLRQKVEKQIQHGPDPDEHERIAGPLPHSPQAKKIIENAVDASCQLNHKYVGTEHILLGLLRQEESVAAQVLTSLGQSLQYVRDGVLYLLGHKTPNGEILWHPKRPPIPPSDPRTRELDETIDRLIAEKDDAIAKENYVLALILRDQIHELHRQRTEILSQS